MAEMKVPENFNALYSRGREPHAALHSRPLQQRVRRSHG